MGLPPYCDLRGRGMPHAGSVLAGGKAGLAAQYVPM